MVRFITKKYNNDREMCSSMCTSKIAWIPAAASY